MGKSPIREVGLGDLVEGGDDDNDQDEAREGVKDIDETHHEGVSASAKVSGNHAVGDADDEAYRSADQTDGERDSGTAENSSQKVTAMKVRAAEVFPTGWGELEITRLFIAVACE